MALAPGGRRRHVLAVDSIANYLIGLPLLIAPRQAARLLDLPQEPHAFYQRVLGAVLTGIATALAIERRHGLAPGPVGLGAAGAVTINLLGGGVVALWLASSDADALARRGRATLRAVAGGVLVIGAVEAWQELHHPRTRP